MSKKYTTEECLQEYYNSLEEQLMEKEAMIDWLADKLEKTGWRCRFAFHWIRLAQEAVKKNDK